MCMEEDTGTHACVQRPQEDVGYPALSTILPSPHPILLKTRWLTDSRARLAASKPQ